MTQSTSNRDRLLYGKTLDMAVRVLKPGGFRSFGPNLTVPCPSTDRFGSTCQDGEQKLVSLNQDGSIAFYTG